MFNCAFFVRPPLFYPPLFSLFSLSFLSLARSHSLRACAGRARRDVESEDVVVELIRRGVTSLPNAPEDMPDWHVPLKPAAPPAAPSTPPGEDGASLLGLGGFKVPTIPTKLTSGLWLTSTLPPSMALPAAPSMNSMLRGGSSGHKAKGPSASKLAARIGHTGNGIV